MTQTAQSELVIINNSHRVRRVCFTLNNYNDTETQELINRLAIQNCYYIFGEEVGEQGTPHLQGYIEFKNPHSWVSIAKILPRAHTEKARGDKLSNINYCSKGSNIQSTFPLPRKLQLLEKYYSNVTWKPWQQQAIDIIESERESRTINWFIDQNGNTGKSFIAKYIAMKYDVIIASGKTNDIFNQVNTWLTTHEENHEFIGVIIDVPRSMLDYINYQAIEKLKDGCLYSGKYEGGICFFDHPHILVFANEWPDWSKMSRDRWNTISI